MMLIKDFSNDLGDYPIYRHILNNGYYAKANELYLHLNIKTPLDSYNKHYHLTTLAHLDPPFILNQAIRDDDFYPIFWMVEYVKDESLEVNNVMNQIPSFYKKDKNTFFMTIRRNRDFKRYEECLLYMCQSYGIMKAESFYQEHD